MQPIDLSTAIEVSRAALVDLDASFLFQLGLFIVVAVLLNQIIFKPLMKIEELRDQKTEKVYRDAEQMDRDSKKAIADYERQIADARRSGLEATQKARDAATLEGQSRVDASRSESDKRYSEALKRLEQADVTAAANRARHSATIAKEIADKIVGAA